MTMGCSEGFSNRKEDAVRGGVTNKEATMLSGLETDANVSCGPSARRNRYRVMGSCLSKWLWIGMPEVRVELTRPCGHRILNSLQPGNATALTSG